MKIGKRKMLREKGGEDFGYPQNFKKGNFEGSPKSQKGEI